jgi:hypothetical protein
VKKKNLYNYLLFFSPSFYQKGFITGMTDITPASGGKETYSFFIFIFLFLGWNL